MVQIPVISGLFRRISRIVGRGRRVVSDASLYQYGVFGFWAAVLLVVVSAIGVALGEAGFYLEALSVLVPDPETGFFGSSLTLVLSIISLVFLVVIFLIQNATQEYSSRLSGAILHDQYFIRIIGFVLVASIFTISGSYFSWGPPLTVIGYAFTISTVLLVGALVAFAGYFIDIANIIEYITERVEQTISAEQIYRPAFLGVELQDEEFISQLTSDTQLIVSTCIQAIEENQQPVVDACLESLESIVDRYLDQTNRREVDEDLLNELNDQFQFIGSAAFSNSSRQKYSESVAETIGDIGTAITQNRELGAQGARWANLLKRLFQDSLEFERTEAAHISIRKLGEMSLIAILRGDSDTYMMSQGELEEIAALCSAADHSYLAGLLQNVHNQYQQMYIGFIRALCTEGYSPEYDVASLLDEFATSFNQAKANYQSRYNQQILFAGLFGLQSFAGKLMLELQRYDELEPVEQRYLAGYLEEVVDFLRSISFEESASNHPDIYKGYTQFLYVLNQFAPVEEEAKVELLSQINEHWTVLIREMYRQALDNTENLDHHLTERMSDFYGMIIYFYRDQPDALAAFIEPVAQLYVELSETYSTDDRINERNLRSLYKQLKLYGAWISRFHDPEDVSPVLMDVLTDNFRDVDRGETHFFTSTLEEYDYPTNTRHRAGWWLRPDTIWSDGAGTTGFQHEISTALNGEDGDDYVTFHERLQEEVEETDSS